MTTKTESTAYLLGQTPDWSSETCAAIERVVSLAEEIEEQAASNSERIVNVNTHTDLWNALVDLRASVSSQDRTPDVPDPAMRRAGVGPGDRSPTGTEAPSDGARERRASFQDRAREVVDPAKRPS